MGLTSRPFKYLRGPMFSSYKALVTAVLGCGARVKRKATPAKAHSASATISYSVKCPRDEPDISRALKSRGSVMALPTILRCSGLI